MISLPTSDGHDAAVRRMEWRCRRGMLEMDLLFIDFVIRYLPSLNEAQIKALDKLLDLPDNQLWNLVSEASISESDDEGDLATSQVLTMLRGKQ
jgi:succinate dehydrogenase flavin-adding protein (antitoxin of CptAB toxin-antitoxin module)